MTKALTEHTHTTQGQQAQSALTHRPTDMHSLVLEQQYLPLPRWQGKLKWFTGALAVHVLAYLLATFYYETPAQAPEVFSVSMLPLSPSTPTPPAPAPKAQPVIKKQAPVATPKPAPSNSPTAISQNQTAATSSSADSSNSNQAASGSDKPSQEVAIVAAHDAAYLNNPKPPYPALSVRLREQGKVTLEVYVLENGTPARVEIYRSSGYPRLDDSARETVKRWKFVPARRGNDVIAQTVYVPIPFSIVEK